MAASFLETDPDIGLDVFQQVAKVDGAICVRQGTGNKYFASGLIGHDNSFRWL